MRSRFFFVCIVGFWLVMNFLLWRSQWDGRNEIGNAVPFEAVWQRILTAPDTSTLEIYDHDRKIGLCHWVATIGNSPLDGNKMLEREYAPDSSNSKITGYTLNLDGTTGVTFSSNRVRFDATLSLAADQVWQDFRVQIGVKPNIWEVHALAPSQKVVLTITTDGNKWNRTFNFSDLQNPEVLLEDLGASYLWGMVGMGASSWGAAAQAMQWVAHEDRMSFGHSRVRIYRLEARFLGQPIRISISRVGEILLVELPNQITLRNDALSHF